MTSVWWWPHIVIAIIITITIIIAIIITIPIFICIWICITTTNITMTTTVTMTIPIISIISTIPIIPINSQIFLQYTNIITPNILHLTSICWLQLVQRCDTLTNTDLFHHIPISIINLTISAIATGNNNTNAIQYTGVHIPTHGWFSVGNSPGSYIFRHFIRFSTTCWYHKCTRISNNLFPRWPRPSTTNPINTTTTITITIITLI